MLDDRENGMRRRAMASRYIEFAKLESGARFNLAASGVAPYPLADLPVRFENLELNGPVGYGYAPLVERLAAKCDVPVECVVEANGTSMGNHLAMAAVVEPGDEVLIEEPTYEPLVNLALYLGAQVRRFPRSEGFGVDPAEVERRLTPGTRLIVLAHLHNPTGGGVEESALQAIGRMARGANARVLVDEVYLEADFDGRRRSAFHLDPERFIVTSSLTKAYGLGGLRCGWILAEPDLARRLWRLNDLFGVTPAYPAEQLSLVALDHLDQIRARAQRLLKCNRPRVRAFLQSRADLEAVWPPSGTIVAPRLKACLDPDRVDRLSELLGEKYETSIVPGRFFEMPEHFRLGMGGETEILAEGLKRLGMALDELAEATLRRLERSSTARGTSGPPEDS